MSVTFNQDRLIELIGRLCDGEINEAEAAELESTLLQHKEARRLYHLTVGLHRDLQSCEIEIPEQEVDGNAKIDAAPVTVEKQQEPTRNSLVPLLLAAIVLLAVSIAGYQVFNAKDSEAQAVATVTESIDARWPAKQPALGLGDEVSTGRLQVDSGTICLTFEHGVVMTVEGPADLELLSQEHVALHDGRVVAYVPDGAEGFTVSTDTAKVIDLGTEFAVATNDDGSSDVVVFDGEVELAAKNSTESAPKRIVAGLAYRIDRTGSSRQKTFQQSSFEDARTVIRRRQVIRESFRNDRYFPGEAQRGWTEPWSMAAEDLQVNQAQTGIRTEPSLAVGTKNFLTIAGNCGDQTGQLRLQRGFASVEEFDTSQPYTLEFLLRLECEPTVLRKIRVFGVQAPGDAGNTGSSWELVTTEQKEAGGLAWTLNSANGGSSDELPLRNGETYRFLIEVDAKQQLWRASISDGSKAIWNTLGDGNLLNKTDANTPTGQSRNGNLLGWQLDIAPEESFQFSLDAIRIQNNPAVAMEVRN